MSLFPTFYLGLFSIMVWIPSEVHVCEVSNEALFISFLHLNQHLFNNIVASESKSCCAIRESDEEPRARSHEDPLIRIDRDSNDDR